MRGIFTEDFFKNVIGFATILVLGIGVTIFAGGRDNVQPTTPATTQTAATHKL